MNVLAGKSHSKLKQFSIVRNVSCGISRRLKSCPSTPQLRPHQAYGLQPPVNSVLCQRTRDIFWCVTARHHFLSFPPSHFFFVYRMIPHGNFPNCLFRALLCSPPSLRLAVSDSSLTPSTSFLLFPELCRSQICVAAWCCYIGEIQA
ncbi:hypothetical protein SDJN03_28510, partial [Cucurbita argyrosperma subsp. sororia]